MELEEDEDEGPTLRSASHEIDDWVVVQHIAEGQHTEQRKLDCYPIEQLWVSEEESHLLLLVNADDDNNLFDGPGARMDTIQHMDQASILSPSYYRLQCTIIQKKIC